MVIRERKGVFCIASVAFRIELCLIHNCFFGGGGLKIFREDKDDIRF